MDTTCRNSVTIFFVFNDTATTEIYTLSLHDALPICSWAGPGRAGPLDGPRAHPYLRTGGPVSAPPGRGRFAPPLTTRGDRKSPRLNSRHAHISYAVFFLKKKQQPVPHAPSPPPHTSH